MNKTFNLVKEWETKTGLNAVCIRVQLGHLCGYVGVSTTHPWHGKDYNYELEKQEWDKLNKCKNPFKGSPIDVVLAASDFFKEGENGPRISYYINVHGGITYAGGNKDYPVKNTNNLWWFGFDCCHDTDTPEKCDLDFVVNECESMAEQLAKIKGG